ncbi:MAG: hypothetical protein ABL996_23790 [Micropepsaceae bacterium]
MRLLLIASAALLASTAVASAEAFTFTSTGTVTNQVGAPGPGGRPIGATFSNIESQTTWASGKKSSSKGTCGAWSAPPGGGITTSGACSLTGPDGNFSASFACASLNDKNTMANCWGSLTGTSGMFQGKGGTISWRATQSADGKSNTSVGSGQWY